MRECLQKDYKHQFYEDFYRVAVQNEKYDDWSSTLILLQSLFTEYCKNVLEYHKKPGCKIPKAFLSTAAHGNFLEVLNISLNGKLTIIFFFFVFFFISVTFFDVLKF